jgi:outer membrane protein assembly factor BamD (BamD/ComL family)
MRRKHLTFMVMMVFFFSGCLSIFKRNDRYPQIFKINLNLLKPDQFPDFIDQMLQVSESNPVAANRTKAILVIARARIHHNNPSPDYTRALTAFEKYLEQSPDSNNLNEILDWIGILRLYTKSMQSLEQTRNEFQVLSQQHHKNEELI